MFIKSKFQNISAVVRRNANECIDKTLELAFCNSFLKMKIKIVIKKTCEF